MSVRRSTADVESILRRTYAEVAKQTTVEQPIGGGRGPALVVTATKPWRRQMLAAAAVLVLVVGGLFVLANRGIEQSAGRDGPTRIVPGWAARFTSSDGAFDLRSFALTELTSDSARDRITYASAAGSITAVLDRTRGLPSEGDRVMIRGGQARRTVSTLSWLGPDNALVEVSWSGAVDDSMIDLFVQSLAYVDEDVWSEVAGTGGFRRSLRDPLDALSVDADRSFDVEIVGDLHQGLQLQVGPNGFLALGVGRCSASVNFETSDPDAGEAGYVLLAPGNVTSVVVTTDGDDRQVDVTSLLPLIDVAIGGVVLPRPSHAELPSVDCGQGS